MKLSIIIVSHNSQKDLARLLPSVFNQQPVGTEVILIDNASTDKTVVWLKQHYPQIKLIVNKTNRGFGAANNQGIKAAANELIFLLNPDTRLQPDCLRQIVDWFERHPDRQLAGCQLLNPDGSIQPSGGFSPTLFKLFCWAVFIDDLPGLARLIKPYQTRDLSFYRQERSFDWLMGAALICRRAVFKQIGYFDEKIFLYAEETELCWRAKQAGLSVWLLPKARVIHWGYDPAKPISSRAVLGEYQGLLYLIKKHWPKWQQPLGRLVLIISIFLRRLVFGTMKANNELAQIYKEADRLVR